MIDLKKVGIITNFKQNFTAYSLCIVNERYIQMLTMHDYPVKFVCMDGFKKEGIYNHPLVEVCPVPNMNSHNEWQNQRNDPTFESDIDILTDKLREYLKDCSVVVSHDLFFQASMERFDVACRKIAEERPNLRWLHLVHSCIPSRKKSKFPNSFIIYPNGYDISRVAKGYGFEEDEIKVVPHPIDVCGFFGMNPISERIIKKYDILQADCIMTYPLRLDRGKQPEMNIKIMKELKKMGKSVKMIFMDFHSTGGDKAKYREELKVMAKGYNLDETEVIFVSEEDPSVRLECPREMVKDFMCISNVFCLPSRSETFSLVAQEAMICGNFPILNFDFSPMRSIYGDRPLYRKFSSSINIEDGSDGSTETKYGNENNYFRDIAGYIVYELEHDKIMAMRTEIRKNHNLKAVFKKYFEPLIYYEGK